MLKALGHGRDKALAACVYADTCARMQEQVQVHVCVCARACSRARGHECVFVSVSVCR